MCSTGNVINLNVSFIWVHSLNPLFLRKKLTYRKKRRALVVCSLKKGMKWYKKRSWYMSGKILCNWFWTMLAFLHHCIVFWNDEFYDLFFLLFVRPTRYCKKDPFFHSGQPSVHVLWMSERARWNPLWNGGVQRKGGMK